MPVPLESNKIYHVYNRANGNEKIFTDNGNYIFFLEKYRMYIGPIADTFCYCLMPNHFHFLIRIKNKQQLELCQGFETLTELNEEKLSALLSRRFSHLFNSYAQAINKQRGRKGSLFMRPFKRKSVDDEIYLRKLVHYIHYNPVEAGLSAKPEEWKYSSYHTILSQSSSLVLQKEVVDWFEDKENFIHCHRFPPAETGIENF